MTTFLGNSPWHMHLSNKLKSIKSIRTMKLMNGLAEVWNSIDSGWNTVRSFWYSHHLCYELQIFFLRNIILRNISSYFFRAFGLFSHYSHRISLIIIFVVSLWEVRFIWWRYQMVDRKREREKKNFAIFTVSVCEWGIFSTRTVPCVFFSIAKPTLVSENNFIIFIYDHSSEQSNI